MTLKITLLRVEFHVVIQIDNGVLDTLYNYLNSADSEMSNHGTMPQSLKKHVPPGEVTLVLLVCQYVM